MATQVQLRRGTTTQNNAFTGAQGELSYDTTLKRLRVHDGATAGGFEIKTENAGGDVLFADGEKAIFGAGSDLQIYHTGTESIIAEVGTGDLNIEASDDIRLRQVGGAQNYIYCHDGGEVILYHNGSQKIATSATGIDVTGTVTADGLTVQNANDVTTNTAEFRNDNGNRTFRFAQNTVGDADLLLEKNDGTDAVLISTHGNSYFNGGNVGIGGTPDSGRKLHIEGGDATVGITLKDTAGSQFGINSDGGSLIFKSDTAGSERMRIDSSGNLLVGKTGTAFGTAGIEARAGGTLWATASGANAASFNRLSTDGAIAYFNKDGTTVGSIGTTGGKLYIGTQDGSDAFLRFESNEISPCAHEGSFRDNVINLGKSVSRFKDLYLSGGVYLGGTGAANKLDDYEEGTWTPVLEFDTPATGITYSEQQGTYTKVGRLVTVQGVISLSSKGSGGSGRVEITGIPFNSVGSGTNQYSGSVEVRFTTISGASVHAEIGRAGNYVRIMESRSGLQVQEITEADCANNSGFLFTITYETA